MITIKLEIDAGESIENAFEEAIRISTILNIRTEFNFNEVKCFGYPNGDKYKGANSYKEMIKITSKYKFAHCI